MLLVRKQVHARNWQRIGELVVTPAWLAGWSAGLPAGRPQRLATLSLPSGEIIACDPLVFLVDARPFTRTVEPGTYEVYLGMSDGDIAYAFIRFSNASIVTWEVARRAGDATTGVPGFPVDSGTAAFVDARVAAAYRDWQHARQAAIAASITASPADATAWHEAYRAASDAAPADPMSSLIGAGPTELPLEGGNLISFPSGAGDGSYPVFWGLDAGGAAVVLAIDFGLLDQVDDAEDVEQADDQTNDKPPAGPSPVVVRARVLLARWEAAGLVVLKKRVKRDELIDALAEHLVLLGGRQRLGEALSAWLLERREIDDVFATDDELQATLAE